MIPEEAVEVAAKDIFRVSAEFAYDEGSWEELAEESRQAFRDDARRILEAAAPYLVAAPLESKVERG